MASRKKEKEAPKAQPAKLGSAFLFLDTVGKGHVAAFAVGDVVATFPVTVVDKETFAAAHTVVEVGKSDDDDDDKDETEGANGGGSGTSGE